MSENKNETLNEAENGNKSKPLLYDVKIMCGDGFAGRNYYMFINGIRIEICLNNGDYNVAKEKTLNILKALHIEYNNDIEFQHDGWM